ESGGGWSIRHSVPSPCTGNGPAARGGPGGRQMRLRIGINLGDVLVDSAWIYGDGVNIAARGESLAAGGGICISGTVYDQVESKLELKFDYIGEQTVKNISRPVRVYRVVME